MKTELFEQIESFLSELKSEVDILNCVDVENIDIANAYDSIYSMIDENDGFDVDIIYYSRAIEYLKENDPSLNESLSIASELGFTLEGLSSEILASLLASQNEREEFSELKTEINEFFEELENK